MGLFSWLRGKQKQAETPSESLIAYNPKIEQEEIEDEYFQEKEEPFKKRVLVSNGTITVYVFPSGNIYSESGAKKDFINQVIECTTEEEIRELFEIPEPIKLTAISPKQKSIEELMEDPEEDAKLSKDLPEMVESGEFEERGGALYLKRIDLSIPKVLAREMRKAAEEENPDKFNSLKNFWYWSVLNPDPIAREDMFPFLVGAGFKITPNGNFLARRMVKKVQKKVENKGLTEFISNQYLKIKKNKKSPKNFIVSKLVTNEYSLDKIGTITDENTQLVGVLSDLYQNLSSIEDNEYTDMHTQKMKIIIGQEVTMERKQCNADPNQTCSRGLHVAAYGYNISGNGDTVILVSVNPMNVVAVPKEYGAAKMRVCAYMPLAIVENDSEALEILKDADSIQIEDTYFGDQVSKLEDMAKNADITEVALHSIGNTSLNSKAFVAVLSKLEEAKNSISSRVVEVN